MKIERASAHTGVINVDGKLWVRALSARDGRCSLTGDPVRIGDRVYVPQKSGHPRFQRILASVVEERLDRPRRLRLHQPDSQPRPLSNARRHTVATAR